MKRFEIKHKIIGINKNDKPNMKNQTEHKMQVAFFNWIRLNLEYGLNKELKKALSLCYANPNGAPMSDTQRIWMVAEGMTKGMPDVNLDWPVAGGGWVWAETVECPEGETVDVDVKITRSYHGLRIEHKHRDNVSPKIQAKIDTGNYLVDLSPEQKEKRELLIEAGYKYVVSYSTKQSIRAVFDYLPFEKKHYQDREYLN